MLYSLIAAEAAADLELIKSFSSYSPTTKRREEDSQVGVVARRVPDFQFDSVSVATFWLFDSESG